MTSRALALFEEMTDENLLSAIRESYVEVIYGMDPPVPELMAIAISASCEIEFEFRHEAAMDAFYSAANMVEASTNSIFAPYQLCASTSEEEKEEVLDDFLEAVQYGVFDNELGIDTGHFLVDKVRGIALQYLNMNSLFYCVFAEDKVCYANTPIKEVW